MNIISTHKNTDFDALASVVAAAILYPDAITVLPGILNPNVRAFISLHKDFFEFCLPDKVDMEKVERLIVVDTSSWRRLDRLDDLRKRKKLDIHLYDHHEETGDLSPTWECRDVTGANITLMIRFIKDRQRSITPLQANLFLMGLYEDTGNLTFSSTTAEDARAAAYLLENGGDLNVIGAFLSPVYRQKHKEILYHMLQTARRMEIKGHIVSINRYTMKGYVENLAVVMQMYRQILNVDAVFGIFELSHDRVLVIGRSDAEGIDVGGIMKYLGGGGHKGAGSAMLKSADSRNVEEWIRLLIGESHHSDGFVKTLMSNPVVTFNPEMMMEEVKIELRKKRIHGAPVEANHHVIGMISLRDFRKRKKKDRYHPVKAFMSEHVIAINPWKTPAHAAQLMVKHDVGRLPVIEDGRLVGIISRSDVMNHLYGFCPVDRQLTKGCNDQLSMLQT